MLTTIDRCPKGNLDPPSEDQSIDEIMEPEELLRIIDLCRTIEKKGLNPFEFDVEKALRALKEYLPRWKLLDELLNDAEAIREISRVIRLQSDWIRSRASFAYDPLLIELRIKMLEPDRLAQAFFDSWHPIALLERISPHRLIEALDYWSGISREEETPVVQREQGFLSMEDLYRLNILSNEEFTDLTRSIMDELENLDRSTGGGSTVGTHPKVGYWDFIRAETFEETVKKAYLLSFLITDGSVLMDPLDEIISLSDSEGSKNEALPQSIAISIDSDRFTKGEYELPEGQRPIYDRWKKFGEDK